MSVIGLDIGFNKFGVCILHDGGNISSYVLANTEKKVDEWKYYKELSKRFDTDGHLHQLRYADLVCLEKPFGVRGYATKLHELLGIFKYKLIEFTTPYVEVPQTTLKKFATGKGNAQKSEMVIKAYKEFGFEATTEDEVDAFWCVKVGLCLLNNANFGDGYPSFSKARVESIKKLRIVK